MIRKLKRKFIALATLSMFALMTVLLLIINMVNFSSVVSEIDQILEMISMPNAPFMDGKFPLDNPDMRAVEEFIPRGMSPEIPFESRYFTVSVTPLGEIKEMNTASIISVDRESAKEYISKAVASSRQKGFIGQFRFMKSMDRGETRIAFLDCGRKLNSFYKFMWISIAGGILGCLFVFGVFWLASDRILRPIAESYEKQKRFITDAGHEIKTPLTIIRANIDLLEEDMGNKEELEDIKQQTIKLTDMTRDLVYLSKMEEVEDEKRMLEFDASSLIMETAEEFQVLAASEKIKYEYHVQQDMVLKGLPDEIRRLVEVLLENAMKYSAKEGNVKLNVFEQKKQMYIDVYNQTDIIISGEELSKLFERFYRTDASRNSDTGGHGIGLSIAKAITESHNGSISASIENEGVFHVSAFIPMN